MIIDYRKDPNHARCYDVIDATTGEVVSDHVHLIYADSEAGIVRSYAVGAGGYITDDGIGPRVVEDRLEIRIELKATHRNPIALPRIAR